MVDAATTLPKHEGSQKRTQLPEEVASYVRELIISGVARPGDFLRMEPIAEAVGVSNTPVREGLLSLRSEGLVRLVPRRGFVVAPFGRQDIRDLFWAQAQLASELTARAAQKITPEQLSRLERNIERYEQAVATGDKESLFVLGHDVHREVNLAADSMRLALLLGSVVKQLPNRFYAQIEGQVDNTREAHPLLLATLRKHETRKARKLMHEHIITGANPVIESLERRGMWADEKEQTAG